MDLFGVGGGLLEYRASLLAGKGFAVMALAYYNYDDLPQSMEAMHLEYFEEAVNYLLRHPEVRPCLSFMGCPTRPLFMHALGFTELSTLTTGLHYPDTHCLLSSLFMDVSLRYIYSPLGKMVLVVILEFWFPVGYSIS